ncbi:ABC transporter substrate-binding protein [Paenibacillus barengoltzii]|uniref:Carbohydrate ABC transporter substrate-binding protein, CUT1 family (TC 3.A.1.1.-) n=1 Tax=Paenibacillus barengoltzii J12 TaxID=935846 RepID=A0ABY1LTC4_9BACL|nr:extracellular solute-binding protein [Paenibacillus barengoltzii]SME99345.1 carbohydrate ABC transporter substrate-binding protein, CUT1 family (TC 3.A.1.1.-) [Paenibacillus barengoltzii J12]
MRVRKVMVLILGLLLILSACSGGAGNGSQNASEPGTNRVNESTNEGTDHGANTGEEEGVYRTPEMEFDLGSKTIKIVSWWDMTIPENNPDNIQRKKNLEALMEKHNFKVEYVPIDFGEYQDKVTASLIAGEPIGDIVRLGKNYTIPMLVKQDLLWPVDQYTKNTRAFDQLPTKFFSYEGKGYGFSETRGNLVQGIFYNRTLMNQLGLKPLQEYVNEDTWNWDTFIEVAKSANKDTNNDGKLDTWGLASSSLIEHALYSNNTGLTREDKQILDDPATLEALNFVSRLNTEKVGRPKEGGDWTEPGQFFRQGNTLMYAGAFYELSGIKTDMPDYDIGFVPFPKGPSAKTYHSLEGAYQALTIPKTVSNPEQLLYIWEKINDIDSIYDYPDQADFETAFTTEDDLNNARTVVENLIVLDHRAYPNLPYWEFVAELNEGVSVSTLVEKYKATFQSAIDEVHGP